MRKDKEFFDNNYHMFPFGENGILFTAYYAAMVNKRSSTFANEFLEEADIAIKHALYVQTNDPLSHDNMTAIVCMSKMFNMDYHKKYTHREWWRRAHPRDIGFYLYAKFGLSVFLIPTILSMMYACYHKQITMGVLDTDGKLLSWLRCEVFGMTKTMKVLEWILRKRHNMDWADVFKVYFWQDDNHPINRHARSIYKK